ncbi:MAG: Lipoprotein signal peptidase [Gemmatimonadaceae bacterium]|nr:Lipoprotein signal peptidase [Gemmatimonadaceae bacterium]
MTASRHRARLSRLALLVAAIDLATKYVAVATLSGVPVDVTDWLRLTVVHNDQGAFGISLGSYTRQLNLALTLSAIALVVPVSRDLSRIDRLAPTALGLIVGGALGNLTSLVLSTRGVVDFIAIGAAGGGATVLNLADVAAYAGLALLGRTAFLLLERIRRQHLPNAIAADSPARLTLVRSDREVPIVVATDGIYHDLVDDTAGTAPMRRPGMRTSDLREIDDRAD